MPTLRIPTQEAATQEAIWQELSAHLTHWFHEPDLEAFKIILCGLATHYYTDEDSLCLLVIGASGSGKTEIITQSFSEMKDAQVISSLTPKCFLSGMQKGKGENSMLVAGGESQIWIAKDFTSFTEMRQEARSEVGSAIREITDGYYSARTGAGAQTWTGKLTLLAVGTPAVEECWAAFKALGDRFLTLRWRSPSTRGMIAKRRRQSGHKTEIRDTTRELVGRLLAGAWTSMEMPESREMEALDRVGELVNKLQTPVKRYGEGHGDMVRSVKRKPEECTEGRMGMGLSQIARTHHDLFHGDLAGGITLARRLALDGIPPDRRAILECIPSNGGAVLYRDLLHRTNVPRTSLKRDIEDLCWLGVLEFPDPETRDMGSGEKWNSRAAKYTRKFQEELTRSGICIFQPPRKLEVVVRAVRSGHKASFLPEDNEDY